ncbi:MAG: peptidylprolyl isomerase [Clostridia bacterium]|nr:peptidylprolyl isomerase [Clostridia bacterium]
MKTTLKLLSLLLAAFLILPIAGCAKMTAALSYGENEISTNVYRYWLSSYKGRFLYSYTDMTDTDQFWDSILYDNVTTEEYLNGVVLGNVKRDLICMELFDQYKLSMPDAMLKDIDLYITDLINEYANGNTREFNAMLANFGINADILRDIYIAEDQKIVLYDYLYGENGPRALSEEDLDAYYRDNYVRVRHIYVNDANTQVTNEAGYPQYDSSGNALTRALTEAELAEKQATIDAIDAALANGEEFADVYEKYSEDKFYVNGYYLTEDTPFISEVVDAAFDLEIGSWVRVESNYGTHYIKRLELEDNAYNESTNKDFFNEYADTVASADFFAYLESLMGEITVNEEEIARYSVRDAAVNYSI